MTNSTVKKKKFEKNTHFTAVKINLNFNHRIRTG